MELDRVVKNKKHQPPHHLGQVAVVDVHGVKKKNGKNVNVFGRNVYFVPHANTLGSAKPAEVSKGKLKQR